MPNEAHTLDCLLLIAGIGVCLIAIAILIHCSPNQEDENMPLKENWTRDAHGNYVDWTQPPYRQPGSGRVHLVLEGEDYEKLSSETRRQRIMELEALERRGEKKRD